MDRPRFRVNAKQTSKGLWQLDITVELNDLTQVSIDPADGKERARTPAQIWAGLESDMRAKIHAIGGKVLDEEGGGK